MSLYKPIADRIRRARTAQEIDLQTLADDSQVTVEQLANLEVGDLRAMTVGEFRRVCQELSTGADWLLDLQPDRDTMRLIKSR
jgi:hypothetical protein